MRQDGNVLVGTFQLGPSHILPLTEITVNNSQFTAVGLEPSSNLAPGTPGGSVTYQGTIANNRMQGTVDLTSNNGQRGVFHFEGKRLP
jgi:hypothetical protein